MSMTPGFAGFLIGQLKTENAILRDELIKREPKPMPKLVSKAPVTQLPKEK
jgi:hypothetical protein